MTEPSENSKGQGALLVWKLWNIDCTYIDLSWSTNQPGESEATRKMLVERSPGSPVFFFPKTQALWSSKCYFLSLQEVWGKPGTMPSHNSLPNKYAYHLIWSVLNKWQHVTEQQSQKKKVQHVFWLQESLIQSFGTEAKNRTLIPFECPQSPTFLYHTKWPGRKVLDI